MKVDLTIRNYRCFEDGQPLRFTLRKGYTAFVGPNNSGKSSILKFFHEFRTWWGHLTSPGNYLDFLRGERGFSLLGVLDETEVFCNYNNRDLEIDFAFPATGSVESTPLNVTNLSIKMPRGRTAFTGELRTAKGKVEVGPHVQCKESILNDTTKGPLADLGPLCEFFKSLAHAMYIGPFRNAINVGATQHFDINVGTAFINTWHDWKTGHHKKHNELIQSVSRDIQHIFRYRDLEIIAAKELNTLQIYADGRSYKLHELGGGIAQFIVVLGNAATRQPSFILIDEPELNLHPTLQLDFLTSLASYSKDGILFATHSFGLARSASDQVYSVQKVNEKANVRPYEQTANLAEFLGELNFAGFKELGFDKLLLVEGVHDLRTVQQFLRFIKKDHEVALLPLGGSQMITGSREIELAEILRITRNVSALIDSERGHEGASLSVERQAFCHTCSKLGIKAHALDCRAIENYFTESAIQGVKGPTYKALAPFQRLENAQIPWGKHENWRIARAMKFDDIKDADLGKFLLDL